MLGFVLCLVLTLLAPTAWCQAVPSGYEFLTALGPSRLYNFDGAGSQTIFHFTNDYHHSRFLITVNINRNHSDSGLASVTCPDTKIHVGARDNGIPVIDDGDATLAPRSLLNTSHGLLHDDDFSLLSNQTKANTSFTLLIEAQQGSSHVFVSAFLPAEDGDASISLAGLNRDCQFFADLTVFRMINSSTLSSAKQPNDTVVVNQMKRHKSGLFDVQYMAPRSLDTVGPGEVKSFSFHVYPITDSGGTLYIRLSAHLPLVLGGESTDNKTSNLRACMSRNTLTCDDQRDYLMDMGNATNEYYLLYPQSGEWYIQVYLDDDSANPMTLIMFYLDVRITACVESCHRNESRGECRLYQSDEILYAGCKCVSGWRGVACTDGRNAKSYGQQLLETLLLTMSNLMFVPCCILAIYRHLYTETLVYFYVFFMSSFYHACDQTGQVVYCLLPYDTLQYCDFLASVSAIWFTLVVLARTHLPELVSFLHILGLLTIATLVSYDRFNMWTFIIPGLIGLIVVASSWCRQSRQRHRFFPARQIWLFSILPGVVVAGVGFSMYALLETKDNYYITHSVWHICMACSVLFLMPGKSENEKAATSPTHRYQVEVNYGAVVADATVDNNQHLPL